MSKELREAAQQALEALERFQVKRQDFDRFADEVTALRAALAEDERDWSLLDATQESLREHMAEIQRLRAALTQPATIAEWWAAKQAASEELSSVSPEAQADFVRALHGGKGDLDAWLECYDETEVRAHVLALVHQPAASGGPVNVAQFSPVTVLPDGSAFATASFPLPKDHWLTAPRGEWDNARDQYAECPLPILTHAHRDAVQAAVRYAVRGATMCGQDADFDPDALVLNAIYALCGPFGCATAQPAPARVPLTDEQINQITAEQWGAGLGAPYAAYRAYARAIEAAHGITPAKEAP